MAKFVKGNLNGLRVQKTYRDLKKNLLSKFFPFFWLLVGNLTKRYKFLLGKYLRSPLAFQANDNLAAPSATF